MTQIIGRIAHRNDLFCNFLERQGSPGGTGNAHRDFAWMFLGNIFQNRELEGDKSFICQTSKRAHGHAGCPWRRKPFITKEAVQVYIFIY